MMKLKYYYVFLVSLLLFTVLSCQREEKQNEIFFTGSISLLQQALNSDKPVVLFLFSVNDCGTCLNFLNQMDYFAKVYKNIRFMAVLSETDTLVYEKIKKQYDLCFDILLDSEKTLKRHYINNFLYENKPVVFVVKHGIIGYKGILGVPKYSNKVEEIVRWIKNRGKQAY